MKTTTTTTTRLNATRITTRHGKLVAPDGTEYRVVPRVRGQAIPWALLRGLTEGDWISITAGIRQHGAYAAANALILPKD